MDYRPYPSCRYNLAYSIHAGQMASLRRTESAKKKKRLSQKSEQPFFVAAPRLNILLAVIAFARRHGAYGATVKY